MSYSHQTFCWVGTQSGPSRMGRLALLSPHCGYFTSDKVERLRMATQKQRREGLKR